MTTIDQINAELLKKGSEIDALSKRRNILETRMMWESLTIDSLRKEAEPIDKISSQIKELVEVTNELKARLEVLYAEQMSDEHLLGTINRCVVAAKEGITPLDGDGGTIYGDDALVKMNYHIYAAELSRRNLLNV